VFSFWIDARLFGRHAAGFHVVNLLLHAGCVLLLWRLLRRLFPNRSGAAWLTTLVFAVHPLHAEAVVGVVGRAELWAAFWCLLAYLLAVTACAPVRAIAR